MHQGTKASWGLEAQDALEARAFLSEEHHVVKYIFYDGCFLFLHDFLAISWLF